MGRFADRFESYFFPVIFLCLAGKDLYKLVRDSELIQRAFAGMDLFDLGPNDFITLSSVLMLVYLVASSLLSAFLLMRRSSAPKRTPDNWREIVVPLVATFGAMGSSLLIDLVPSGIDRLILPDEARAVATVVGSAFVISGLAISITAEWHLNTSYGVFVQVREPVMTGMYAHVRHPMYASYFFVNLGIFLLYPMVSYALCSLLFMGILIYRARLEEAKLSDYSEEYRRYKEVTPMIVPGLKGRRRAKG